MTRWLSSFVILALISNPILADQAEYLPKGTAAPFEGYLLTPAEAQNLRRLVIEGQNYQVEASSYRKSFESQKQLMDLSEQKIKLYSENSDKLAKELQDARSTSDLTKALWFIGGLGAAILGGWAVGQASK